MAATLGLSDVDPWAGWLEIVRRDGSDWLLCRACAADLDDHLRTVAAAAPSPPPRRLFGGRR